MERNFRIHTFIGLLVVLTGILFRLSTFEWLSIILVIGLVLVAEIFNSAIEKLLDYLNPAIHPSAKIIKDLSAGAVLASALVAIVVGLIIFFPRLIDFFI